MSPGERDDLWRALEGLRDRPVVAQGRDYARRWARSHRRIERVKGALARSRGAILAACAAIAVIGAASLFWTLPGSERTVETTGLEMRTDVLPDGSTVMLNTSSRLRVAFSQDSRNIALLAGEAHFEVAKDPARPFRVRAGHTEIVAVGTVFDVARLPTETKVTLIEGRVDVRALPDAGSNGVLVETLQPSQQLSLAQDGHVLSKTVAQLDSVTAWQHGTIRLDDVPLTEALSQINRYSAAKIAVADPALAAMRVSGVFRIGDTKAFVAAVERYFGLKARWQSEQSVVLERP